MEHRTLGRTGREVSVIGLGTWQLGADWGEVSEADAMAVPEASAEAGVTFLDTADVYGDARSERLVGRFLAAHPDVGLTVATKMGRRAEQVPESCVEPSFREWLDRSRANLGVDTIDLVQLHCPPSEVIDDDATYDVLDRLVDEGVVAAYGISVETAAQALSAIARPHVASVQIILNAFRMKSPRCSPRPPTPVSGSSPGCRWRRACCSWTWARATATSPTAARVATRASVPSGSGAARTAAPAGRVGTRGARGRGLRSNGRCSAPGSCRGCWPVTSNGPGGDIEVQPVRAGPRLGDLLEPDGPRPAGSRIRMPTAASPTGAPRRVPQVVPGRAERTAGVRSTRGG